MMYDRVTIEIPVEFREAMRLERFQKRITYREIVAQMFAERYGMANKPRPNGRRVLVSTPDGTPTGA